MSSIGADAYGGTLTLDTLNYTNLNPPIGGFVNNPLTGNLDCGGNNLTNAGAITTGTLNYTTLNPPISTGFVNNPMTVLLAGGNQDINNVNDISSATVDTTGNITVGGKIDVVGALEGGSGDITNNLQVGGNLTVDTGLLEVNVGKLDIKTGNIDAYASAGGSGGTLRYSRRSVNGIRGIKNTSGTGTITGETFNMDGFDIFNWNVSASGGTVSSAELTVSKSDYLGGTGILGNSIIKTDGSGTSLTPIVITKSVSGVSGFPQNTLWVVNFSPAIPSGESVSLSFEVITI
mgnify:CR=1 FL=1